MIAGHIARFARLLRAAGMPVGPDRVLTAVTALEQVGIERRVDVHAALSAVMQDSHAQQPLFDAAFEAFWRPDGWPGNAAAAGLAMASANDTPSPPAFDRIAAAFAAMRSQRQPPVAPPSRSPDRRHDRTLASSDAERLQNADFATMTAAEFALAKRIAEELPLPMEPVLRRRQEPARNRYGGARIDLRATMRGMARQPQTLLPAFSRPRREAPTLVVLLDISGSMQRYARLLLHYAHGLTRRHSRVHTLVFGTRLTNISRSLRHRDPDVALQQADAQVRDWRGGTRIASCLADFNRTWARRLLGGNAALLLMTDGLDRDEEGRLGPVAAQLRRRAHRIVWLNPLLRFDGFEPRAAGVRALLPHVDRFLPVHNLASLADLAAALRRPAASHFLPHSCC